LEFQVDSSIGFSSVSASSLHSGLFGSAHLVPRNRSDELEVVVSGYALQCKHRSLMLSSVLNLVSVSNFLLDNWKLDFKFSYACYLLRFFQFYRIIDKLIFLFAWLESITVIVCNLVNWKKRNNCCRKKRGSKILKSTGNDGERPNLRYKYFSVLNILLLSRSKL
jgi:hypothetical protein